MRTEASLLFGFGFVRCGWRSDVSSQLINPVTKRAFANATQPQTKRSQVLKPRWQELIGKAMLDTDESHILELASKVLATIDRLLSVHAVVGEPARKFPKADLVKRRDAIQKLVVKLNLASANRKALEANPQFATLVESSEDLAAIKAHASTQSFLQSWLKHGLVDHELLFLEAMGKAGFTWGGIWQTPDFHHFEMQF